MVKRLRRVGRPVRIVILVVMKRKLFQNSSNREDASCLNKSNKGSIQLIDKKIREGARKLPLYCYVLVPGVVVLNWRGSLLVSIKVPATTELIEYSKKRTRGPNK